MARTQNKPPTACPNGPGHETRLTYDGANDEFFVACMVCGLEGPRKATERDAKTAWTKRQGLTEMDLERNDET